MRKGTHHTDETKKKLSKVHKGKTLSEEHKRKIGDTNKGKTSWIKGKHHSEETKKKIGDGNRGKIVSSDTRQKLSDKLKIVMNTPEMKEKYSRIHKGKIVSEETKQRISNKLKGKPLTEEHKRNISRGKKGISGKDHPAFKENAKYKAIHIWISKNKPKSKNCEICGLPEFHNDLGKLELSNITGKLIRDINNFQYVHHSCHFKFDKENNIIHERRNG